MWREKAETMFFRQHKRIQEIAEAVGKTRKTVSVHLATVSGFAEEKERRKKENVDKRQEYKRNWEQNRQSQTAYVQVAMMKRQHNIDVAVLSAEKYY